MNSVTFDKSGSYLATGGKDLRVYTVKEYNPINVYTESTNDITGIRFSENAKNVFTVSLDKYLRTYTK